MRTLYLNKYLIIICLFISIPLAGWGQKTGLVLSGGGASGFAHIGVIKALEEKGIPIDYITGTSSGALVGSMYACGMSPAEMEALVLSERFLQMATGKLPIQRQFFFQVPADDASTIDFSFAKDSILKKSLPTNFIKPALLDYEMMAILGTTGASTGDNFDNLFVPFRCVASDIIEKKTVVFSHGKLNEAVRASMTYPFYINPIRVNGQLLFDGGLYNNFPGDIMYKDFGPDYIIGSNVSANAPPPTEDDLISQITNMLVSYSNFTLPCEYGIIIEPNTSLNTFNFNNVKLAIDSGYAATLKNIEEIKKHIHDFVTKEEIDIKRKAFKARIMSLNVRNVSINEKGNFLKKSILKKGDKEVLYPSLFEKRYFRAVALPQIEYLYPTLSLNDDSTYTAHIHARKAKDFNIEVGGHFTSRPINTGYVGLNYYYIGPLALHAKVESYFGKFYGSVKTAVTIQLPFYYPISFTPYFVQNRWDYYRSNSTFFEDVKPAFLIQNEIYAGLKIKTPVGNKAIQEFDLRAYELKDSYYQTQYFNSTDTSDRTRFNGQMASWKIEKNTLNRKQFASSGTRLALQVRYVSGVERSKSGSTSQTDYDIRKKHDWISIQGELQEFFINKPSFHLGIHAITVLTSQSLFSNYKASLLSSTAFSPVPDASTLFLEDYRSPQFMGVGTNMIFTFRKNFDIRLEVYYYQPFKKIILNDDGTFNYSKFFTGNRYLASGSVIYHSPIGPLRLTMNYFPLLKSPFLFQFSYGFVLFNERAIR